ncbi:hypothetical protein Bca101_006642 [Brassica carinata]
MLVDSSVQMRLICSDVYNAISLFTEAKCGVCQGRFSSGYGGYACIDKTCDYVVHSTCATNINVWDGIDVEGEFKEVCEACILPIDMGTFLGCKECSFALHEESARLPPEMEHPLHRHRITVQVQRNINEGFFTCSACKQDSCGFMYQCCQEECGFKIDVKCASFTDPFKHKPHKCPLYLRLEDLGNRKSYLCCGCHEYSTTVATCIKCKDSSFDFKCLNLPPVIRYKYDIHPLTLYFDRKRYEKQQLEKFWKSNFLGDGDLKGDSIVSAPLVDETATALSVGVGDEGKQRPFHRWLSSTKENTDLSLYRWLSETGGLMKRHKWSDEEAIRGRWCLGVIRFTGLWSLNQKKEFTGVKQKTEVTGVKQKTVVIGVL